MVPYGHLLAALKGVQGRSFTRQRPLTEREKMEAVLSNHGSVNRHTCYFYNFVTQLCHNFQEFNGPFIDPGRSAALPTHLVSLLVYNEAFKRNEMGWPALL